MSSHPSAPPLSPDPLAGIPASWPHRDLSRFVDAPGIRWHVQSTGAGPVALLLHGTGAATHSWASLMPLLASRFTVVAIDLPAHGFTSRPANERLTIDGMARDVTALCAAIGRPPAIVVGHSAGAAVALAMTLHAPHAIGAVVGMNAALVPPNAWYRTFVAPFVNPIASSAPAGALAALLTRSTGMGRSLVRSAGTPLDAVQEARYAALLGDAEHAGGVLAMMANWDLDDLVRRLPGVRVPVTLVSPHDDPFVALDRVRATADLIPRCSVIAPLTGGHIVHEHDPAMAARVVVNAAIQAGIIALDTGAV